MGVGVSFGSLPEGYERAVALGVPGMALRFGTGIFADGYNVSVIEDDGKESMQIRGMQPHCLRSFWKMVSLMPLVSTPRRC